MGDTCAKKSLIPYCTLFLFFGDEYGRQLCKLSRRIITRQVVKKVDSLELQRIQAIDIGQPFGERSYLMEMFMNM